MKRLIFIPLLIFTFTLSAQFTKSGGSFLKNVNTFLTALESDFPQILSGTVEGTSSASDATAHPITMPTGVQSGNLILVFFSTDGPTTVSIDEGVSDAGWSIESQKNDAAAVTGAIVWKISDGADVLQLTTSGAEKSVFQSLRLSGFYTTNPLTVTNASGNSTNYDPPSNIGEYGAVNYLWFVVSSSDAYNSAPSAAPADFEGGNGYSQNGLSTSSAVYYAYREYKFGTAYDPGTFTANANEWVTFTIIVNPLQ